MQVAARVAELNETHHPDAIFIDGGGPGAGVSIAAGNSNCR